MTNNNFANIRMSDLLHLAAELSATNRTKMLMSAVPMMQHESMYYRYLVNAGDPSRRDYNLLREALRDMQIEYREVLERAFESVCDQLEIHGDNIDRVYDLGSGLSIWPEILQDRFDKAQVTCVDRQEAGKSTEYPDQCWMVGDITELLTRTKRIVGGKTTVIFMSEFLHCKFQHRDLMQHPTLKQSYVIVNECHRDREPDIDRRLQQTDGRLLSTQEIHLTAPAKVKWSTQYYQTLFSYYLTGRGPV